jgi:hypothetical protein
VSFRFKQSSCVAVGAFNIYVIHPRFLKQIGLVNEAENVRISGDLSQPGFRFSTSSTQHQLTWYVRPDRLTIKSQDPEADCGQPIAAVLEALAWTPLTAVGSNVELMCPASEIDGAPWKQHVPALSAPDGFTERQRTAHMGLQRGEEFFNIQIATGGPEIEVSVNVHSEWKQLKDQREINRRAVAIASSFRSHVTTSIKLAQTILGAEIANGRHND